MIWYKKGRKIFLNPNLKIFLWLIVLTIVIYLTIYISSRFNPAGVSLFNEFISDLFKYTDSSNYFPGQNLWILSLQQMWVSIRLIVLGTIVGFLVSLVSSYFGARKIHSFFAFTFYRFFIILLRALPIILFARAFSNAFRANDAAFLTYSWFTWLWVHRYLVDMINNSDLQYFYKSLSLRNSKIKSFYLEVFWRIKIRILNLYFFSLESNFRWISLLGAVGIIGTGTLIYTPLKNSVYDQLGAPLTIYFIFLLLNELMIFLIKKYLFHGIKFNAKTNRYSIHYNHQKIILLIFGFISFIIAVIALANLEYDYSNAKVITNLLERFFQIDLAIIFDSSGNSPISLVWDVLLQTIIIWFFTFIIGTTIGIFQSEKINKKAQSLIFKIIGLSVRIIPSLLVFYLLNILWFEPITTIFLVLVLHSSFNFAVITSSTFNKINFQTLETLRKQGFSYFKILRVWVIPASKKELIINGSFLFENLLRDVVYFGVFGANRLGAAIQVNIDRSTFFELANFSWPLIFITIVLEYITNYLVSRNIANKETFINKIKGYYALYKKKIAKKNIQAN
ncbi:phosphonate transport system permease protein [Mycoplasmopsis agassizii]|uniref:ABC transmembrane type-1 domain-containing protein n=1 Tax=Mycoplasmopsis agassizii TaxID=33922 RepID=A0ABX4H4N0_9BACT|nr:hypothetical protein CJF60_03895 [Mycoplasmopsis agassizii]SMC18594.1 phosphonate transport system permease protein [Mycoplasmopsis agassizii]